MTNFYYFAYGSNMLTARLKARCPSVVVVGRAEATGYIVEFSKPSMDLSGKATLSRATGSVAPTSGVLFEIQKAELGKLDRVEGLGHGYDRHDNFPVQLVDAGVSIEAKTYLATETDSSLKPYDWYLALVIAGVHEHGLGETSLEMLRSVAFEVDRSSVRKSRIAALEALIAAGHADYRKLLTK